jgi:hypothetical protein
MATNPSPDPTPPPKKRASRKSLADILRNWESLLGAVADHATDLSTVEPHRAALAESLDQVRAAKGAQALQGATRQTSTQTLQQVLTEGQDRAIRLRGAIRAELGPTTEMLTQFGIRPLRRRRRPPASTPTPPPAAEIVQPKPPAGTPAAVPATVSGTPEKPAG